MQAQFRILFGVLFALCWSGIATADPLDPDQSLDPAAFRAVTTTRLDVAFEQFVTRGSGQSLGGLAGPSSMNCTRAKMGDGTETCVVTAKSPSPSRPAALARD